MLKAWDKAVLEHIKLFTNKIPVVGLQNDDSSPSAESVVSQIDKGHSGEGPTFPAISVFRNPEVLISDSSVTKRAATSPGISQIEGDKAISLLVMRASLTYTVDVFDTTRASAEEIALRLYYRLRNNPQVSARTIFKDFKFYADCIADLHLKESLTNMETQGLKTSQIYKIRFSFTLDNVNLYDLIGRDLPKEIHYFVTVSLSD